MFTKDTSETVSEALIELTGSNDVRLFIGLIEMMHDGILLVDRDEKIIFANRRMCEITGFEKEELIGEIAASKLVAKEVREKIIDQKLNDRISGISETYDIRIQRKDETPAWLRVSGSPVYDISGNIVGSIGVHADITDEKKKELALQEALEKEKQLSQSKSDFVAIASHQFRTPLAIIQSNVELMSMKLEKQLPDQCQNFNSYVDRVKDEIKNMSDLMDEILMIDKLNSGKFQSKIESVDVVEIGKKIKEKFDVLSSERGIDLEVHGSPKNLMIDRRLLNQSLMNLVSNAYKYSSADNPKIILTYQEAALVVEVCDTGIGIPVNEQKFLFDPFFRGSNVEGMNGTGLGLSIVKNFMDQMGGEISICSEPNNGTNVTLSIPINH